MIKSLIQLRNTTLGSSEEVSDVEKSLEEFKVLQYAVLRKTHVLSDLLKKADWFHLCFFTKAKKSEIRWW
uniref:Uncharacterized protein n=1 Tax=Caenorhabditis japonica TaxID=281687 RepID=A0A8R1EAQ7_CAEJA